MAVNSVINPTLMDLAKRLDPDNKIATIVELLMQTNEILDDMTWMEGNLPTGHRTTVRTGLPAPTWRKLYGGVQPAKSTTRQITDNTGMMEAYAEVDKALADLNDNTDEFRLSEDRAFIEGMSQEMASTLMYGNEGTEPEAFTGLSPRYNDLSAENAENIIDAQGTGTDNASIWLAVWSPNTVHGIIPKGSTAGLQMQDMGEVTIENVDGNGGRMQAYRTHYRWDAGFCVRDWRYLVRICNIDKSDLDPDPITNGGANLPDLMFQAMELIPNMTMGRPAFYMSREIRTMFRRQLPYAIKNSTLEYADVGGRRTAMFQDVPLRRVDAMAADEARVV